MESVIGDPIQTQFLGRIYAARMGQRKRKPGELALIETIRRSAETLPVSRQLRLGIGDDCAILQPPAGTEVLVTTDMSLESRHFDRQLHPAASVGHRCLARGLSDLAAMGASPMAAFLSLALPVGMQRTTRGREWIQTFLHGLLDLARTMSTPLAGGDTAAAPAGHIIADIVLLGTTPTGTALRRSGARAGDHLYVTGALGGAAAELTQLRDRPRRFRTAAATGDHPHLYPAPRLRVGSLLRSKNLASAAIDVSDGLSTDLHHVCEASGVGAVVELDTLPIHPLARSLPDGGVESALHGGEDYELLFAARPGTRVPKTLSGIPIHRIGRFTQENAVKLRVNGRDEPLHAGGWEHAL